MKSLSPPDWPIVVAALLSIGVAGGAAGAEQSRSTTLDAVLAVEVDANGRALSIEPTDKASRALIDYLRPEVARWEFEPGRIDGVAVAARTSIMLSLEARQDDDDVSLRIVRVSTGPRYDAVKPPRYPENSMRFGEIGEVLVRVDVSTEGLPESVAIERSNASRRLEKAALAAVKAWTFVPESVGGRPVPATVLAPVNFCIEGVCRRLPPAPGMDIADDSPRLVGEPAVRLKARRAAG